MKDTEKQANGSKMPEGAANGPKIPQDAPSGSKRLHRQATEAEYFQRKVDETRQHIRDAAGIMRDHYQDASEKVADAIRKRGMGEDTELEDRYLKLIRSRHICDRVHGESKARAEQEPE